MKSTERFSANVEDYIKYRPGYTQELISFINQITGGLRDSSVADIGSGTGKLTEPLLSAGATVYAVEPNPEMRAASESMLFDYKAYQSIDGTAEHSGLSDHSVDLIVAAQAFHWFDSKLAQQEFKRLLKDKNGYVFLIWNNRNNEHAFMKAYEDFLLKYSTDYNEINHANLTTEQLSSFFGVEGCEKVVFENNQYFDFNGLKGRYDSCSYALPDTHELYLESISSLQSLFDQFCEGDQVTMFGNSSVHYGML